jgi:hypothetical protein
VTSYSSSLAESLGTSDAANRTIVVSRSTGSNIPGLVPGTSLAPGAPLVPLDSIGFTAGENLSTIDVLNRGTHASRSLLDADAGSLDTLSVHGSYPRHFIDTLATNDLAVYVILHGVVVTETTSISDSPRRLVGVHRGGAESLTLSDSPGIVDAFYRASVETEALSTFDSISVYKPVPVFITNTLTTSDSVVREVHWYRNTSEAYTGIGVSAVGSTLPLLMGSSASRDTVSRILSRTRSVADTTSISDSVHRILEASRINAEMLHALDIPQRHINTHRALSQSLTTSDLLAGLHNSPRHVQEFLTTTDAITHIQMFLPIMGYIWYDPITQTAQKYLPDWGFILIEDPIAGVTLNFAPIDNAILSFTREK